MSYILSIALLCLLTLGTFAFGTTAYGAKESRCESQFKTVRPAAERVVRYSMRPSLVQAVHVYPAEKYHGTLKEVAQVVKSLRPSSKITETVLYPFAGFDFSAPLILFPNAKTYIMIDRNPVIEAFKLDEIRKSKLDLFGTDRNRNWVIWSQTGNAVFENILKSLFSVSPKSKIEKIDFIVDEYRQTSLELRFVDGRDGKSKTLHYWVGEVAPLPSEMGSAGRSETGPNWWHDTLLALNPRTLLLKGSHSLFRTTNAGYVASEMRDILTRGVRKDGGLIVEGASDMKPVFDADWVKRRSSGLKSDRARWELTDGDPVFGNPVREAELSGIEFSYSDKVHASIFAPSR